MKPLKSKLSKSSVVFSCLLLLPVSWACSDHQEASVNELKAEVKNDFREFKSEVNQNLDVIDRKIDSIEKKISQEATQNKRDLRRQMKDLRRMRDEISVKMDKAEDYSSEKFEAFKSDISVLFAKIQKKTDELLN